MTTGKTSKIGVKGWQPTRLRVEKEETEVWLRSGNRCGKELYGIAVQWRTALVLVDPTIFISAFPSGLVVVICR